MIGQLIRDFRKSKGITQKKLCEMTGLSQAYLSQIEADTANPTFAIIQQICMALGVELTIKKKASFRVILTQEEMDKNYEAIRDAIWDEFNDPEDSDEDGLNRKADAIFEERYGFKYSSI